MATVDARTLRARVRERAEGRCEYCFLPEDADLIRFEIDHVIAEQHSGKTELDNLAYACFDCNKRKGPNIASIDPETNTRTWLFHPRTQKWTDHFRLSLDGTLTGLTAEGRATVFLLQLNEPRRIADRCRLIELGRIVPQLAINQ